ncbi:MAG TPA: iron-containing redox enzyme family protein [Actinomycetota bacterium]|nr:iron-containing redox enzyme family protein [Actinomycetota bacterium]
MDRLPPARGPLTETLLAQLRGEDATPVTVEVDPRTDDDLHLALYLCYQLHYGGVEGVSDDLEWDPAILAFRDVLEAAFENALLADVSVEPADDRPMVDQLRDVVRADRSPAVAMHLQREASVEQFREFMLHRSTYHLKEADPFTWLIPRLGGGPKAALVQIQADEYGGGDAAWMHSTLFARTMTALGLDPASGPPLERIPGTTLAVTNLLSLFGLHRRLRGQAAGALALFEMTSCIPNRRYGDGMRRLGFGADATRFFDEHVEADAVHEAVAATDLAGALVDEEGLGWEILFGARALQATEGLAAAQQFEAWTAGRSSLLPPSRAARHLAAIP